MIYSCILTSEVGVDTGNKADAVAGGRAGAEPTFGSFSNNKLLGDEVTNDLYFGAADDVPQGGTGSDTLPDIQLVGTLDGIHVADNSKDASYSGIKRIYIEAVAFGQGAIPHYFAFNARPRPELCGTVIKVFAGNVRDESTGESYYRTNVAVDPKADDKLANLALLPRVPAEAFMRTGKLSPLSNLAERLRYCNLSGERYA